jgi:Leucine-rich repeat (LRR) protein
LAGAFKNLEELQLNDTLLTWRDLNVIAMTMPHLKSVELGHNQLMGLSSPIIKPYSSLQSLNLDSNSLSDWVHVCSSLADYDRYFSI